MFAIRCSCVMLRLPLLLGAVLRFLFVVVGVVFRVAIVCRSCSATCCLAFVVFVCLCCRCLAFCLLFAGGDGS